MSADLVKQGRFVANFLHSDEMSSVMHSMTVNELCDRIEQLERELAEQVNKKVGYYNDWMTEKALADRLWKRVKHAPRCDKLDVMTFSRECTCGFEDDAIAYRKARVL